MAKRKKSKAAISVGSKFVKPVKHAQRAKTKSKYKKEYIEVWQCGDCDFQWAYRTIKCPLCYSAETTKII